MSGYVIEDQAGLWVVVLWIFLFICFALLLSIKLHCKGQFFFFLNRILVCTSKSNFKVKHEL